MSQTKCYAKPIYLLIALVLVLSLGIAALPMAGMVEANGVPTTFFTEDFEGGLPGDWTVLTSQGCDWRDDDPDGRGALDGCSGIFMIADSDWCGYFDMDTELITPSIDCSNRLTVILEFDHYFKYWVGGGNETGDVDIWDGSAWHNKAQYQSDTSGHVTIDISDVAAGKSDVKIRWHYYDAYFDWYWEVDNVELSGVPIPLNVKYLHCTGGLFNLTAPIGTQWHELYPLFCREYHLSSWEDNGDGILSPSDQIDMYEKPDGEVRWYHVDEVTITLYVTPRPPDFCFPDENGNNPGPLPPPMYIELEGGYNLGTLMEPISSHWHEIYPNFCTQYQLIGWNDTAEIGRLDFCDYILLGEEDFDDVFVGGANLDNHMATCWHVEEVAVDITVTIKPPPVGGEAYPVNKASLLAPWIAAAVLLAGGTGWFTLRRRRAQS